MAVWVDKFYRRSLLKILSGQKSERFDFADNHEQPIGQRVYTLSREAVQLVVELTQVLLHQGQSVAQIMEVLMPV